MMPIVDMNVVRLWARKIAKLYKTHQDSLCKICNAYAMHCKAQSEETWPGHPSALLTALPRVSTWNKRELRKLWQCMWIEMS